MLYTISSSDESDRPCHGISRSESAFQIVQFVISTIGLS